MDFITFVNTHVWDIVILGGLMVAAIIYSIYAWGIVRQVRAAHRAGQVPNFEMTYAAKVTARSAEETPDGTVYRLTFQAEREKEPFVFTVGEREYERLHEGDEGELTVEMSDELLHYIRFKISGGF